MGTWTQDLSVTQLVQAMPAGERPPEAPFLRSQKGGKEPLKGDRQLSAPARRFRSPFRNPFPQRLGAVECLRLGPEAQTDTNTSAL